jgi:hypothetical protein
MMLVSLEEILLRTLPDQMKHISIKYLFLQSTLSSATSLNSPLSRPSSLHPESADTNICDWPARLPPACIAGRPTKYYEVPRSTTVTHNTTHDDDHSRSGTAHVCPCWLYGPRSLCSCPYEIHSVKRTHLIKSSLCCAWPNPDGKMARAHQIPVVAYKARHYR